MKHWLGYGNGRTGHDRSPVDATDRQVRNYYLPAFREAVRAGVKAAMRCVVWRSWKLLFNPPTHTRRTHRFYTPHRSAYIEIDGVPMTSNRAYTVNLLRHDLGWQGVLKPDYQEMDRLFTWHNVANSTREAARLALADTSTDQFTATPVAPADMLALVSCCWVACLARLPLQSQPPSPPTPHTQTNELLCWIPTPTPTPKPTTHT